MCINKNSSLMHQDDIRGKERIKLESLNNGIIANCEVNMGILHIPVLSWEINVYPF